MNARSILVLFFALLPAGGVKNGLLRRLGWTIGRNASIGPCLALRLDHVHLGDGARIGPFNVFRDMARLHLGDEAQIGQWNWFTASLHMRQAGSPGDFELGTESAITSRHYVDCTGGVRIGSFTTIAGERSTFVTHGISWVTSDQTFKSIEIGDFCLISSNAQIVPGTRVGDRVVVGMGATIAGSLSEPGLYVQPRASLVKNDLVGEYFHRKSGAVDSVRPG